MKNFGEVLENIDLKKYNTYGISVKVKYLVKPYNKECLIKLIKYLDNNRIKWYLLGGGSNIILPDEYFDGVIINLSNLNAYEVTGDEIYAEAGIYLTTLIDKMLDDGYTNYGVLKGIPGQLGGAIVGNAGAYGINIFDYLNSVFIIDENYEIKEIKKEKIDYDYRWTEFKNKKIVIVAAKIKGVKGDVALIKEEISKNFIKRKNTQPLEYKNAGSVFANPKGLAAGYLIDHSGLKNISVGGAKVSEKHANFIINYNNATSHDIINLIEIIKKEVKEKFKVELKLEQVIVKW